MMLWAKSLTIDERISLPKMDDVNSVFVSDAVTAIDITPSIMPGYITSALIHQNFQFVEITWTI